MRFIPTKIHGIIDYLAGALFIASPWLFGFNNGGAAQWVPVAVGVVALVVSVFTDYELGLVKQLPMPVHLTGDVLEGIVLATSPWLFGFADFVYVPHLVFGLFAIGAGLLTEKVPYQRPAMNQ